MLASRAPKLESVLLAAKMAGHEHVSIDGTLIETDRCRTPGPTKRVDLWWSGRHGWNIQVITARREHLEILPALVTWIAENRPALGDLGYEGEAGTITVAFRNRKCGQLTDDQKTHNTAHNGKRAIGEHGNSLLK